MTRLRDPLVPLLVLAGAAVAPAAAPAAAGERALTFEDLMRFRQIEGAAIADDGSWIAYALVPDRGDGEAVFRSVKGEAEHRVARGAAPRVGADGRWGVARLVPPFEERERAGTDEGEEDADDEDAPKPGLAVVELATGAVERIDEVEAFALSDDGRWLAWRHHRPDEDEEEGRRDDPAGEAAALEGSRGEPSGERRTEERPSARERPGEPPSHEKPGEGEGREETFEPEISAEEPSAQEPGEELPVQEEPPAQEEPPPAEPSSGEEPPAAGPGDDDEAEEPEEPELGSELHLRDLASGAELVRADVLHFALDETSSVLAFDVSAPKGEGNGLFAFDLRGDGPELVTLHAAELAVYSPPTWAHERPLLAFVASAFDPEEGEPRDAELWTWDGAGEARRVAGQADAPEGHELPAQNELAFSRDGERLFFGFRPAEAPEEEAGDGDPGGGAEQGTENGAGEDAEGGGGGTEAPFDPYAREAILDERTVDVWHWDDPWIQPNQRHRWEEEEKDRVHLAVAWLESGRIVPLADAGMPELVPSDNPRTALGYSDVPYRKLVTWEGFYSDAYLVDLETGERELLAARLEGRASPSPSGRFAVFYRDGAWHLHDRDAGVTVNVTHDLGVPFANEDHDYPKDPPGYGQGGWLADDSAVLIYDKYDVWQVFTDGRTPLRLTSGREDSIVHRVVDRDPDEPHVAPDAELLLRAYHDLEKHDAFVACRPGEPGTRVLYATGRHRLRFVAQAEDAEVALVTRERYDEFPDLWATDFASDPVRLSDANPQIDEFAWGSAELVEWRSLDGEPLQGVLIRPGNYEEGRRYPVLVYFYRFFSQRLHEFNEPVVNHRPSFPLYASNGYAVFLPDVRFEVGHPGVSAVECLVPGVQELVDMGIADPDAIGLHGHSWSGYQAAFVITRTDVFAACVAGAPVSNMTSAYGGIRYGTGLARQFQYEESQSRIGASLWEAPHLYIENSPLFHADRIDTPLLIQFGDEDEAVPWTQGIELYLACRRLGKECIFLQYRGEPHHLERDANQLDYSIKMKQFLDHHLQGTPAPEWMTEGVPYRGD